MAFDPHKSNSTELSMRELSRMPKDPSSELVKDLPLQLRIKQWDAAQHVKEIIEFCSNAESLSLFPSKESEGLLIKERQNGYMQKVSFLTLIQFCSNYARSCPMALTFRNSLTHMYLRDGATLASSVPTQNWVDSYNELMAHAAEFKNAKSLPRRVYTNCRYIQTGSPYKKQLITFHMVAIWVAKIKVSSEICLYCACLEDDIIPR